MNYQKYDVSCKQSMVEEFIREKERSQITMRQFAHEKGIPLSTFSKWYRIYISAVMNDDISSNTVPVIKNKGFIELSASEPVRTPIVPEYNDEVMKLRINGAEIEFPSHSLTNIIKALKELC